MPRYRAKSMLFVDGARIKPGQTFSSDSTPNDQWEPIDSAPAPKGAKQAPAAAPEPVKAAGAPQTLDEMSDEQLRDFIQTKSPSQKRPADKYDREKLLELARRFANPEGEA